MPPVEVLYVSSAATPAEFDRMRDQLRAGAQEVSYGMPVASVRCPQQSDGPNGMIAATMSGGAIAMIGAHMNRNLWAWEGCLRRAAGSTPSWGGARRDVCIEAHGGPVAAKRFRTARQSTNWPSRTCRFSNNFI